MIGVRLHHEHAQREALEREYVARDNRYFHSVKEQDGSYTIRQSSPRDIVESCRGCNVQRRLDSLTINNYRRLCELRELLRVRLDGFGYVID